MPPESKKTEVLAVIPARGGSKGIPRKNLIDMLGKPLIAHTIEQAKACKRVTRVMVSTDDDEIAQVSRRCGAEVPFMRPAELARDQSLDLEVFDHVLRKLKADENYEPELLVHLRATGPIRRPALIDQAIELMLQHPEATALRSVSVPELTPYKMWRIEDGLLKPLMTLPGVPEAHSMPRQKLPEVYWHNPYVDIIRPRVILEMKSMVGDRILPFVVRETVLDIDGPEILPFVELEMRKLQAAEAKERP